MLPYETRFVDRDSDAAATREDQLNEQADTEKQGILRSDRDANSQLKSDLSFASSPSPQPAPLSRPLSISSTAHELPASLQPELSADDFNKTSNRFQSGKTNEEFDQSGAVRFHLDESAFHDSSLDCDPSHRSIKQQQQLGLYEDPVDESHKYLQNRFISPELAAKSDLSSNSGTGSASHSRQVSMTDADWNQLQAGKNINSNAIANSAVTGI